MEKLDSNRIKLVMYDFYKTLSDSRYFHGLDNVINEKINNFFQSANNALCNRWWSGEICSDEFLVELSNEIKYDRIKLEKSLQTTSKHLTFNKYIFNSVKILKEKNIKVAIVTINSDFFTRHIVPQFGLQEIFDHIANSSDYKTLNKLEMIKVILSGADISPQDALLIDDNTQNLNDFSAIGGNSYHYKDDSAFDNWFNNKF